MRSGFQHRTFNCRDSQGEILSDRKAILERWNKHFKELYGEDKEEQGE
jgi:hypothetical protein